MNTNHCRHIKEDGFFCQGAPLRGREYCRFHLRALGGRMRMARERARREPHRLVLPILEDMNAVQVALMQVLDAVASGQLDDKRAGLLLYGLQQASTNLRSLTAAPRLVVPADEQREGRAEEDPGFEKEFDLPKGLDLTTPPEVVFPAAAATAVKVEPSPYRRNLWRDVGKENIELEEILQTQGEEAYQKRRQELENQGWKEIEREKRQVAEAHRVVEAARRNEREWSSAEQRVFYEKLRAEAEAKAKTDAEDLAAMRAAAAAMAAKKSAESAPADEEAKAVNEPKGKSGA